MQAEAGGRPAIGTPASMALSLRGCGLGHVVWLLKLRSRALLFRFDEPEGRVWGNPRNWKVIHWLGGPPNAAYKFCPDLWPAVNHTCTQQTPSSQLRLKEGNWGLGCCLSPQGQFAMSSSKLTAHICKTNMPFGDTKHPGPQCFHSQHQGFNPRIYEDTQRNSKTSPILNIINGNRS